jgi:hypothetical protein
MTLRRGRLLPGLAAALVIAIGGVGSASGSSAVAPTLYVTYSSNCTFTLTGENGAAVTSIAPGAYQVEVTTSEPFGDGNSDAAGATALYDCGGEVNFQLTGPGVDLTTNLDGGANNEHFFDATEFAPSSSFTALDGNNPVASAITFTTAATGTPIAATVPVSTVPTKTTTSSSPVVGPTVAVKPVVFRGTLHGGVSASGKLSLTFDGKSVTLLAAGRYTVTVADHSKDAAFVLRALNHAPTTVTTARFTGKRSASVILTAGQWYYYPSFIGTKTYFFVSNR